MIRVHLQCRDQGSIPSWGSLQDSDTTDSLTHEECNIVSTLLTNPSSMTYYYYRWPIMYNTILYSSCKFIDLSELKVYIKLKNLFAQILLLTYKAIKIPQLRNKTKKNLPYSTKFSLLSLKSYDSGKQILSRAVRWTVAPSKYFCMFLILHNWVLERALSSLCLL